MMQVQEPGRGLTNQPEHLILLLLKHQEIQLLPQGLFPAFILSDIPFRWQGHLRAQHRMI